MGSSTGRNGASLLSSVFFSSFSHTLDNCKATPKSSSCLCCIDSFIFPKVSLFIHFPSLQTHLSSGSPNSPPSCLTISLLHLQTLLGNAALLTLALCFPFSASNSTPRTSQQPRNLPESSRLIEARHDNCH